MSVQAADMASGKQMLKDMMTQDAINAHMAEKHAGQPAPSMAETHAQIDAGTYEDTGMAPAM